MESHLARIGWQIIEGLVLKFGAVFRFRESGLEDHPWFTISHETDQGYLCVNATSYYSDRQQAFSHGDHNCIIRSGDHPLISHDSAIAFGYAKVFHDSIASVLQFSTDASAELIERLLKGAKESKHLSQGHLKILVDQRLVQAELLRRRIIKTPQR